MKHKTLITSALLIFALLIHTQSIAQSATELAIDTVIKKYFVGINTQDTTLIKRMLAPSAEIKSVNEVGEIQSLTHDEYIDMLLDQQKGDFQEKIGYRHIWHDQEFAQSWMKYEFQIDDYLVHCGLNHYGLEVHRFGLQTESLLCTAYSMMKLLSSLLFGFR